MNLRSAYISFLHPCGRGREGGAAFSRGSPPGSGQGQVSATRRVDTPAQSTNPRTVVPPPAPRCTVVTPYSYSHFPPPCPQWSIKGGLGYRLIHPTFAYTEENLPPFLSPPFHHGWTQTNPTPADRRRNISFLLLLTFLKEKGGVIRILKFKGAAIQWPPPIDFQ